MTEQRTSLITGANTGIGLETARGLARRGDRMILACRSEAKTRAAIDDLAADTGNEALEYLHLDLADLASVRDAARTLVERGDPIQLLVANAGLAGQRGTTKQGLELAFGTNHLGHFLFVTELLGVLTASAPSRIVIVSSEAHFKAKMLDLENVQRPTKSVTGMPEYEVSKLANVLFAEELSRRLPPEVWVGSLHPGVIASDVWRRVPWPVRPIMTRFMKSTTTGAEPSLLLATSDEVLERRGGFWFELEPKDPSPLVTPELAEELWRHSEEWTAEYR